MILSFQSADSCLNCLLEERELWPPGFNLITSHRYNMEFLMSIIRPMTGRWMQGWRGGLHPRSNSTKHNINAHPKLITKFGDVHRLQKKLVCNWEYGCVTTCLPELACTCTIIFFFFLKNHPDNSIG